MERKREGGGDIWAEIWKMGMSPHRKCWRHKRTLRHSREQTRGVCGDDVRRTVGSGRTLAQSRREPSGEPASGFSTWGSIYVQDCVKAHWAAHSKICALSYRLYCNKHQIKYPLRKKEKRARSGARRGSRRREPQSTKPCRGRRPGPRSAGQPGGEAEGRGRGGRRRSNCGYPWGEDEAWGSETRDV